MKIIAIIAVIMFFTNPRVFIRVIFAIFSSFLIYITSASGGAALLTFVALAFPWGKKKSSS